MLSDLVVLLQHVKPLRASCLARVLPVLLCRPPPCPLLGKVFPQFLLCMLLLSAPVFLCPFTVECRPISQHFILHIFRVSYDLVGLRSLSAPLTVECRRPSLNISFCTFSKYHMTSFVSAGLQDVENKGKLYSVFLKINLVIDPRIYPLWI